MYTSGMLRVKGEDKGDILSRFEVYHIYNTDHFHGLVIKVEKFWS